MLSQENRGCGAGSCDAYCVFAALQFRAFSDGCVCGDFAGDGGCAGSKLCFTEVSGGFAVLQDEKEIINEADNIADWNGGPTWSAVFAVWHLNKVKS